MSAKCYRWAALMCFGIMAACSFEVSAQECAQEAAKDCHASCWMHRMWLDADYLYWTIKDSPATVPLVTSGPAVPIGSPVLDQPGTTVVLGGKEIKHDWSSGGRFALGYWYEDTHSCGTEISYFFLPNKSNKHTVSSDGSLGTPFLAVPFFNVLTNTEDSTGVAFPGSFSGVASLKITNNMQGAEWNGLANLYRSCAWNINFLAGFRYWDFNERLNFITDSPFIDVPEDVFVTIDKFHVKNNFYGGQIGADLKYICNRFMMNVKAKVALGAMCEELFIKGLLITNDFNDFEDTQRFAGGYFALPSNRGHHHRSHFSVLPEVNVNLSYFLTEHFRLQVGYTYLYVNNVLRAANQIDRNINPSQSVALTSNPTTVFEGPRSPKASLKTSTFWAQGINAGFEFYF